MSIENDTMENQESSTDFEKKKSMIQEAIDKLETLKDCLDEDFNLETIKEHFDQVKDDVEEIIEEVILTLDEDEDCTIDDDFNEDESDLNEDKEEEEDLTKSCKTLIKAGFLGIALCSGLLVGCWQLGKMAQKIIDEASDL